MKRNDIWRELHGKTQETWHVPSPKVRFRFWVRVGSVFGLASRKGRVGMTGLQPGMRGTWHYKQDSKWPSAIDMGQNITADS